MYPFSATRVPNPGAPHSSVAAPDVHLNALGEVTLLDVCVGVCLHCARVVPIFSVSFQCKRRNPERESTSARGHAQDATDQPTTNKAHHTHTSYQHTGVELCSQCVFWSVLPIMCPRGISTERGNTDGRADEEEDPDTDHVPNGFRTLAGKQTTDLLRS